VTRRPCVSVARTSLHKAVLALFRHEADVDDWIDHDAVLAMLPDEDALEVEHALADLVALGRLVEVGVDLYARRDAHPDDRGACDPETACADCALAYGRADAAEGDELLRAESETA